MVRRGLQVRLAKLVRQVPRVLLVQLDYQELQALPAPPALQGQRVEQGPRASPELWGALGRPELLAAQASLDLLAQQDPLGLLGYKVLQVQRGPLEPRAQRESPAQQAQLARPGLLARLVQ